MGSSEYSPELVRLAADWARDGPRVATNRRRGDARGNGPRWVSLTQGNRILTYDGQTFDVVGIRDADLERILFVAKKRETVWIILPAACIDDSMLEREWSSSARTRCRAGPICVTPTRSRPPRFGSAPIVRDVASRR